MLDIDRLHATILEGKLGGRQSGRTTATIVEALGCADFKGKDILFISFCKDEAARVSNLFVMIAEEMEYEHIKRIRRFVVEVNNRRYEFLSAKHPNVLDGSYKMGRDVIEFHDEHQIY